MIVGVCNFDNRPCEGKCVGFKEKAVTEGIVKIPIVDGSDVSDKGILDWMLFAADREAKRSDNTPERKKTYEDVRDGILFLRGLQH